uniref:Transthyretin-like family protein n=1 Tax=Elaeophora elaphi TaxID=1147741 RepID=A0A0R3RKE4_9BILA
MLPSQLLLLLTLSSSAYGLFGRKKNVTVMGELNCGQNYYSNVKVELWEADTVGPDDKLNTTYTNKLGQFKIFGEAREIRNIEPYIKVHHFCQNGIHDVRCEITDRFDVPKQYQGRLYNLGLVDLSSATKKRKKKCH